MSTEISNLEAATKGHQSRGGADHGHPRTTPVAGWFSTEYNNILLGPRCLVEFPPYSECVHGEGEAANPHQPVSQEIDIGPAE